MKKILFFSLFILTLSSCEDKEEKVRQEILLKANTELNDFIDDAIDIQTAGFGSIVVDELITPEEKTALINENLLPDFKDYIYKINSLDTLNMINNDQTYRFEVMVKSTVGGSVEEAFNTLYDKIVDEFSK